MCSFPNVETVGLQNNRLSHAEQVRKQIGPCARLKTLLLDGNPCAAQCDSIVCRTEPTEASRRDTTSAPDAVAAPPAEILPEGDEIYSFTRDQREYHHITTTLTYSKENERPEASRNKVATVAENLERKATLDFRRDFDHTEAPSRLLEDSKAREYDSEFKQILKDIRTLCAPRPPVSVSVSVPRPKSRAEVSRPVPEQSASRTPDVLISTLFTATCRSPIRATLRSPTRLLPMFAALNTQRPRKWTYDCIAETG